MTAHLNIPPEGQPNGAGQQTMESTGCVSASGQEFVSKFSHERKKRFAMSVEVIDSAELAKRLNVPETWIRSRTNSKRTCDPIPHLRFGRYVRFPWGSEELHEWLNRQLVSTNGQVIKEDR
jgi:hypothetical protein